MFDFISAVGAVDIGLAASIQDLIKYVADPPMASSQGALSIVASTGGGAW